MTAIKGETGDLASILGDALAIMEHGWAKGSNTDGNGKYCIVGAICRAVGVPSGVEADMDANQRALASKTISLLSHSLDVSWGKTFPSATRLAAWNDSETTSLADLVALFHRAGALAMEPTT